MRKVELSPSYQGGVTNQTVISGPTALASRQRAAHYPEDCCGESI
jgi:hypothetical protein